MGPTARGYRNRRRPRRRGRYHRVERLRAKSQHEIDIAALAEGQRRQSRSPTIRALGEAKDSDRTRGVADLTRLDRIRGQLVGRGVDAAGARILLFGRSGFDAEVTAEAGRRTDVELVDLERIRFGE